MTRPNRRLHRQSNCESLLDIAIKRLLPSAFNQKNADIRRSTMENSSSFFSLSSAFTSSLSSSFVSAQWPPCVDVKVGGSVILGSSSSSNLSKWAPKRNSSLNRKAHDPWSLRNEQWTAMERAERVSRDR